MFQEFIIIGKNVKHKFINLVGRYLKNLIAILMQRIFIKMGQITKLLVDIMMKLTQRMFMIEQFILMVAVMEMEKTHRLVVMVYILMIKQIIIINRNL